ncbi:sigma-70 family RNA polymerase sigma factor [Aureimonas pseudogalii]|uniref:RNA polymerase sigma-70 factor (ECF subfamily) n=1 Tax=Aureimonas pseudogalii TaxID=1744844 RepID=A0A7W6ECA5_9HYPH|nr:sigma-70 family RNA polymerase sigma factor [Aureimonas pseudogalii]MBB3997391.1 RNA polymerase sigma-70 factor (ECF subfamily) [Aureimonas pseudogalii]
MSDPSPRPDILSQLAPLRRYALSLTRNREDAEDLVHDTLLRAIEREEQFRPGRNLRTWLLSILHNRFVDGARARRSEAARDAEFAQGTPAAMPGAQEPALRLAELRRSFAALPEEQRAALHLVVVEGLSYEEAAETLGIPQGTLVSRLSRARVRLRAADEGEAESETVTNVIPLKTRGGPDVS